MITDKWFTFYGGHRIGMQIDDSTMCEFSLGSQLYTSNVSDAVVWTPKVGELVVILEDGMYLVTTFNDNLKPPKESTVYPIEVLFKSRFDLLQVSDDAVTNKYVGNYYKFNGSEPVLCTSSDADVVTGTSDGINTIHAALGTDDIEEWLPTNGEPIYYPLEDGKLVLAEFDDTIESLQVFPLTHKQIMKELT